MTNTSKNKYKRTPNIFKDTINVKSKQINKPKTKNLQMQNIYKIYITNSNITTNKLTHKYPKLLIQTLQVQNTTNPPIKHIKNKNKTPITTPNTLSSVIKKTMWPRRTGLATQYNIYITTPLNIPPTRSQSLHINTPNLHTTFPYTYKKQSRLYLTYLPQLHK